VKPKILVLADWYAPGFKAGGLITALSNLADSIGNVFELYIFTRDRDLTDKRPYPQVRSMEWLSVGSARVMYTSDLSLRHLRERIFEVMPDIIYLNSFFSLLVIKTLFLRKLGMLPGSAVVLAPRGEFSPGAMKIKLLKKTAFTNFALRAGLYRNLIWQATSDLEAENIAQVLQSAGERGPLIHVASDLPSRDWLRATQQPLKESKRAGGRFLFVSRISRKKNLLFALDTLANLRGHVEFDIFGPIDDQSYWKDCWLRMKSLPSHVVVRYKGPIPRENIQRTAQSYDFLLLPTQGENFGYIILEAMAAGCPVILSDRTPWKDLSDRGLGWTLPLEDRTLWIRVLQQCIDLEPEIYAAMSYKTREFVESWAKSAHQSNQTTALFNLALRSIAQTHDFDSPTASNCVSYQASDPHRDAKEVLR
jgi:glycosyltransferase involved in cell wall biosynthesis